MSSGVALQTINVHLENEYFTSVDGVLYSKDGQELISYPRSKTGSYFETLSTTTTIREYAFYGNSNLKDVVVGNGVIAIGNNAFDMTTLTSVEFTSSTPAHALVSVIFNDLNTFFRYCAMTVFSIRWSFYKTGGLGCHQGVRFQP